MKLKVHQSVVLFLTFFALFASCGWAFEKGTSQAESMEPRGDILKMAEWEKNELEELIGGNFPKYEQYFLNRLEENINRSRQDGNWDLSNPKELEALFGLIATWC